MNGSTLHSLHGALRHSQRRVSGLSSQTPWTKQAGECSRRIQPSGAATSWTRHMATAQRMPVYPARPAQTQTQTRRIELPRGYVTSAPADKGTTDTAAAAAAAVPELSLPLASILRQMSAAAAPSHPSVYATVHIYGRPYLVTPGDRLRLPFRMAGVQPGDILHLDRVGVVGSRSVTAVGAAVGGSGSGPEGEGVQRGGHVPGVTVTAVVLGLEAEPLRVLIKKKRRNRRKRSVRSKHQYTVLRIQDVDLGEQST